MGDFAKVLVEHSVCYDDDVCNKSCHALEARYGGGYDCSPTDADSISIGIKSGDNHI